MSLSVSGVLLAGTLKLAVRWKTVTCAACAAICGIDWMPDEPVPITATRLAGEIDALVRPGAGVVGGALEALDAGDRPARAASKGSRSP